MLKPIAADEAINVDHLVIVIGGDPKTGKSSLAHTADNPVMFDFDGGAYRANRVGPVYPVRDWPSFMEVLNDPASLSGHDTVVLDTVGAMAQCYLDDLMVSNPKMNAGGTPSLRAYGQLKAEMTRVLNKIGRMGKDLILIAHLKEERLDEAIMYRLDVVGATKDVVYRQADVMGRLYVGPQGQRIFDMRPTAESFGSNPARIDPVVIPDPVTGEGLTALAEIIAATKRALVNEAVEVKEVVDNAAALRADIAGFIDAGGIADPEKFTARARELVDAGAPKTIKRILNQAAKENGLRWDRAKSVFVEDETEAAAA